MHDGIINNAGYLGPTLKFGKDFLGSMMIVTWVMSPS